MFLLALETSGRGGSVALARFDSKVSESEADLSRQTPAVVASIDVDSIEAGLIAVDSIELDDTFGSARTLAPAIDAILQRNALVPSQLKCVAVTSGPGSFTGLRVGVATAKTLAYALRLDLVEVDTLDVIATQYAQSRSIDHEPFSILAVLDAYRGQLFVAAYDVHGRRLLKTQATAIADLDAVVKQWSSRSSTWHCVGAAAGKIQRYLQDQVDSSRPQASIHFEVGEQTVPSAATVASLGFLYWSEGKSTEPITLLPRYYRGSAAEEKQSREQSGS